MPATHICPIYLTNCVNGVYHYYSFQCPPPGSGPPTPVLLTSTSFIWCPQNCATPGTGCVPITWAPAPSPPSEAASPRHHVTPEASTNGQERHLDPDWEPNEIPGEMGASLIVVCNVTLAGETTPRFAKLFKLKVHPPGKPLLWAFIGHEIADGSGGAEDPDSPPTEVGAKHRVVTFGNKDYQVIMS